MRYLTITVATLFATSLGLIAGMIVRGWEATPQTLTSRDDALSVCVRSAVSGEISPLKFSDCITLTFIHVERRELIGSALQLELQLEEEFSELEETRKSFERFLDPPQDSRDEQQSI